MNLFFNKGSRPFSWLPGLIFLSALSCQSQPGKQSSPKGLETNTAVSPPSRDSDSIPANLAPDHVLSLPEVPILCYHQIRDWRPTDSKKAQDYIVPEATFRSQLKMLADSGYHTITPDQLFDYLTRGARLPAKPLMLTFDDTDSPQYTIAFPEMKKYDFKGVFFIMTVSLGRPHYMSRQQVRELSDAGNIIGSHTWDHKNVKLYNDQDWKLQVEKQTQVLESITGKPVKYFAFPFGLWNQQALPRLRNLGFKAAFQLSAKTDPGQPLYTIRRIIVPGGWDPKTLSAWMKRSFK